jgi:hypothetical protein
MPLPHVALSLSGQFWVSLHPSIAVAANVQAQINRNFLFIMTPKWCELYG